MCNFKPLISPHVHQFSLDTGSTTADFLKRVKELGTGALVCTDHGFMGACRDIYDSAKKNNLIPIVGIESYHRSDDCKILKDAGIADVKSFYKYGHLLIHAKDQAAYQALAKKVSDRDLTGEYHGSERKPIFTWEDLEELGHHNVTLSSGCLAGIVSRFLIANRPDIAIKYYEKLRSIVRPGDFMVEIFPHKCDKNWVSAGFIALESGSQLKYYLGKKIQTENYEKISIAELSDEIKRGKNPGKILGVYNRSTLDPIKPEAVVSCKIVQDFVQNECTDFAPDGDIQLACNKWMIETANKYGDLVYVSDDCLVQGTLIRTEHGYLPIEQITPGMKVISRTNEYAEVEAVRGLFSDKQLVALSGTGWKLTATEDHRIWVRPGSKNGKIYSNNFADPEWIEAGKITEGSWVFCPKGPKQTETVQEKIDLGSYFTHNNGKYVSIGDSSISSISRVSKTERVYGRFLEWDEDLALIVGLFLGDGSAHNNLTGFAVDNATWDKVGPILKSFAEKYNFATDLKSLNNHKVFRIISSPLTQWFRRSFYSEGKVKTPGPAKLLSNNLKFKVIEGLLWSDGSNTYSGVNLSMTSLPVISWVRDLCLSEGIWSTFNTRFTTGATMPLYTLYFDSKLLDRVNVWKTARSLSKQQKTRRYEEDGFWIRVRKVERINKKIPVYDLQVSGDHSFAEVNILVHNCHYATKDNKIVQEVKLANMGDSFRFYGSYHLHTSDEAFEYFKHEMGMTESQFAKIIENSHEWANKFKDFKLDHKPSIPKSFYPEDSEKYLQELIDKHGRLPELPEYKERLKKEIDLFKNNGTVDLLPYFFLCEDICAEYGRRGLIHGPGRGSAAGTIIAYLLGITSIDPLKYNLSLDRFISLDRIQTGNLPDIDMDFGDRDILLDPKEGYLFKKFGNHCAKISTVMMLRIKNSMRDVARFSLGFVPEDVEAWAKAVKPAPQGVEDLNYLFGYTTEEGKEVTGYFYESEELQAYAAKYPDQWEAVKKALRVSRGASVHASGVVITNEPVDQIIPLMTSGDDRVTQCPPSGVEASGGIKIDILGLNSLKDIQACMDILKKGKNVPKELIVNGIKVPDYQLIPFNGGYVDVWDLPHSQEVYEMICQGDTDSVFQLGTNSAKKGLKSFEHTTADGKPMINSVIDGAAFVALDRPGPLDASVENENGASRNMLEEYAARIIGRKKYGEIPYLSEALPDTKGILVYQESLTKVYKELTGCSGPEAEVFRKEIGKKKMEKVNARYPGFIKAASEKIGEKSAKEVWSQVITFGAYGFNFSHAVSYFDISYATAFLKYHFPTEWWCAVLQNARKEEIVEKFWPHCHELVVPPQINSSEDKFVIRDGKIIAPLSLIKGLGPKAHVELVAGVPYIDIQDFANKIAKVKRESAKLNPETGKIKAGLSALNSGVVNSLIISGVMDFLFEPGMSLVQKMETYQKCLASALGKKKPDKIKEVFATYNPLQVYQHKKKLLDIYSEDLIPLIYSCQTDGVKINGNKVRFYSYYPEDAKTIGSIMEQSGISRRLKPLPFINGQQFQELNTAASIGEGETLRVAVAAYVEEDTIFSFSKKDQQGNKTNKTLRARKYTLNIDGVTDTLVKWPDWEKEKLTSLQKNTTGSIIVAILSKNRETRPFRVDAIIEVQKPLEISNER